MAKSDEGNQLSIWRALVAIVATAALFTLLTLVSELVANGLPLNIPALWKGLAVLFLVALLATFCLAASKSGWFGSYRRSVQALVGALIGLAIVLLLNGVHPIALAIALSIGFVVGYFGEHWLKGYEDSGL